jgi:hypothetical protein
MRTHARARTSPRATATVLISLVLAAIGLVGVVGVAPAHAAQPADPSLESQSTYSIGADAQPQDVKIAIPPGLNPTRVTGRILFQRSGAANTAGQVDFLLDGSIVKTVAKDPLTQQATFAFPVSAADVSDGYLTFSYQYLTDGVTDPSQVCVNPQLGQAQLDHVQVALAGQAVAPTTLDQFFGPAVRAVSIVVPPAAPAQVRQAGLAAVAAVSHLYDSTTAVTLTSSADASRAAAADEIGGRRIVITPGTGAARTAISTVDGVPTLTLTGDPAGLAKAAAALGNPLLALAGSADTTRLEQSGIVGSTLTRTFDSLGQSAPTVQGLGVSQFIVGVKLSDFGRSVSSLKVHLVGQHAAIPTSISAVLSYYWNGHLVGSQNLVGDKTAIDTTLSIPATELTAFNSLTVKMVAVPTGQSDSGSATSPFDCHGTLSVLPVEVDFDGKASTVAATPGQPFAPGFTRFPQSLGNVMTVALGAQTGAVGDSALTNAASVVASLQRLNDAELTVKLVSVAHFMSSSAPGLVVDPTPDQVAALDAPLKMAQFRTIDAQDVHFGAGVDSPYAALQAFSQHDRDVLLLSSWSPTADDTLGSSLEGHLVDSITGDSNGWYGLYDDLAIAQSTTAKPVLLQSNAISPQPQTVHHFSAKAKWALVVAAVLILAMAAQMLARRRLRRRAARLVEAEFLEDEGRWSDEPADGSQRLGDRRAEGPDDDRGPSSP